MSVPDISGEVVQVVDNGTSKLSTSVLEVGRNVSDCIHVGIPNSRDEARALRISVLKKEICKYKDVCVELRAKLKDAKTGINFCDELLCIHFSF